MDANVPTDTSGAAIQSSTTFPVIDRRVRNLCELSSLLNSEDRRKRISPVGVECGANLVVRESQAAIAGPMRPASALVAEILDDRNVVSQRPAQDAPIESEAL